MLSLSLLRAQWKALKATSHTGVPSCLLWPGCAGVFCFHTNISAFQGTCLALHLLSVALGLLQSCNDQTCCSRGHHNPNNSNKKNPSSPQTYRRMQELLSSLWSFNDATVKLLSGWLKMLVAVDKWDVELPKGLWKHTKYRNRLILGWCCVVLWLVWKNLFILKRASQEMP